jgi:hypothetical protein
MTKITTTTVTKNEVRIQPKTQRKLLAELRAYGSIAAEAKSLKVSMDGHRARVLEIGNEEVGEAKFEIEGYKVALVNDAEDRRLDKQKLIKFLVSDGHYSVKSAETLLERATTCKSKKAYAKITAPGEEREDE